MKQLNPEHIFGHRVNNVHILHIDEVSECLGGINVVDEWITLKNHEAGYECVFKSDAKDIYQALGQASEMGESGLLYAMIIESYC